VLNGPFEYLGSFFQGFFCMKQWFSLLSIFLVLLTISTSETFAQLHSGHQDVPAQAGDAAEHRNGHPGGGWEGSAEGIAYSEFNHRFAGFCDVLFGLAELGLALKYPWPFWTRLILPGALWIVAILLMVWSDHDAWPIGSLSFADTFFGQDVEIIQHKFFGVLAAGIAWCETLRRIGRVRHPAWAAPLIVLTMVGGVLLMVHSHGDHPTSEKIQLHHTLLGIVGVGAALSKAMGSWMPGATKQAVNKWDVVWAGSVILFGLLLLVYSE
jgi:putative copper resistance protein D